jgi:hypothetical protein
MQKLLQFTILTGYYLLSRFLASILFRTLQQQLSLFLARDFDSNKTRKFMIEKGENKLISTVTTMSQAQTFQFLGDCNEIHALNFFSESMTFLQVRYYFFGSKIECGKIILVA